MGYRASSIWRCLRIFAMVLVLLGSGGLVAPQRAAAAPGSTALGGAWAWGSDGHGQLGNGSGTADQPSAVALTGATGITAIAAGHSHSLGLKFDGTVVAWGSDSSGQLGNGSAVTADRFAPVPVLGVGGTGQLNNVVAVAAGTYHSLALRSDGTVVAWGNDSNGQLGNGAAASADQPSPVQVAGIGGGGALTGVVAIAAGAFHSLALRSDGTVVAWGSDAYGQLGNGTATTGNQASPTVVSGLTGVKAIAAGANHSLALLVNGYIETWGSNSNGQLGNGTASGDQAAPVLVVAPGTGFLAQVTAIAAGQFHSLARRTDGTVVAWGADSNGQLGNGAASTTSQPRPVVVANVGGSGALANVVTIASGASHVLALRGDGTVVAWGGDFSGELGNGATVTTNQPAPVAVKDATGQNLAGITAISAGASHSLALQGGASASRLGG